MRNQTDFSYSHKKFKKISLSCLEATQFSLGSITVAEDVQRSGNDSEDTRNVVSRHNEGSAEQSSNKLCSCSEASCSNCSDKFRSKGSYMKFKASKNADQSLTHSTMGRIYKHKFHIGFDHNDKSNHNHIKNTYQAESNSMDQSDLLYEKESKEEQRSESKPLHSNTFLKGINSPSPEFLGQHITNLIVKNKAIVEKHNPLWPSKFRRYSSSTDDRLKKFDNKTKSTSIKVAQFPQVETRKQNVSLLKPQLNVEDVKRNLQFESPYKPEVRQVILVNDKSGCHCLKCGQFVDSCSLDEHAKNHCSFQTPEKSDTEIPPVEPIEIVSKKAKLESAGFLLRSFSLPNGKVLHSSEFNSMDNLKPRANSHIYGGEVQICNASGLKTLKIESVKSEAPSLDLCIASRHLGINRPTSDTPTSVVVKIATGCLNSGGTMVKVDNKKENEINSYFPKNKSFDHSPSNIFNSFHSQLNIASPIPKTVPYVPGIPGPYSQANGIIPLKTVSNKAINLVSNQRNENVIKISTPDIQIKEDTEPVNMEHDSSSDVSLTENQCFLIPRERPNTLAIKPSQNPVTKSSLVGSVLVSPDTPRQRKPCAQMLLNGSAYTFLNLKVKTKTFFCCLYKQQPMYTHHVDSKLSMYSVWHVCKSNLPLNLTASDLLNSYRSTFYPNSGDTVAKINTACTLSPGLSNIGIPSVLELDHDMYKKKCNEPVENSAKRQKIEGGYKIIGEDYTYVRGRGRGPYVCETCGIRCKKPSMLKKHVRTHTDLRPFGCKHCSFSFKTKGNLTKHLKSKAHFKRCTEMGIHPVPTVVDDIHIDKEALQLQGKLDISVTSAQEEEEETEDDEDSEDQEDDEDEEIDVEGFSPQKPFHSPQKPLSPDRPIDLSIKERKVVSPVTESSHLLYDTTLKASPESTTFKAPQVSEIPPARVGIMLDKYLREMAVRDITRKRKYRSDEIPENRSPSPCPIKCKSPKPSPSPRLLHSPESPGVPAGSAHLTVINVSGENKTAFFSGGVSAPLREENEEEGKCTCKICHKEFSKGTQLSLHMNIHYIERPHRCDSCSVSFRTNGTLQKHMRSVGHYNKLSMNMTFGAPSTKNPRPFKCVDCDSAFRIHGHLAKHLRSKLHIMRLECLCKLPFGTYAEIERNNLSLNDIDTTDCDTSLESLKVMAERLYEKDPSKLSKWEDSTEVPDKDDESDISVGVEDEALDISSHSQENSMPPLSQSEDYR